MKIAMMGSGGVGGFIGGRLAHAGYDVAFVARGAHLAAMRSNGLAIESQAHGDIRIPKVRATDDPASIGTVDVIILSVKLWDTESAIRQMKPMLKSGTAVLSLQNGVIKDDILRRELGEAPVMGGVCYVATTIARPGVILQTGPMQRVVVGEYDGRPSERARLLHEALLKAGVAAGLGGDRAPADGLPEDMVASMAHDLQRGNRLEVEWLSGGVVQLGAVAGVPTPANRAVWDILALYAEGGKPA